MTTRGALDSTPGWLPELAFRVRHLFLLKLLGTSAIIGLFFVAYFQVLRHPLRPVALMPMTVLDPLLPFQPAMVYAYVSLWLYVGIAPGLQRSLRHLLVYALWAIGLCLAGLTMFIVWPTSVPPLLDMSNRSGLAGLQVLQGLDAPGNACPSMHVAFAVFTAMWLTRVLNTTQAPTTLHLINWIWCAAIVWSTLAIRQHVVLDAMAGALLGAAWGGLSLRWADGAMLHRALTRGRAHAMAPAPEGPTLRAWQRGYSAQRLAAAGRPGDGPTAAQPPLQRPHRTT